MEIYEFEKTLLDRLEESMNVLCWKDEVIPTSLVRQEWAYYIELQIEPAGWQGLWKIPRVICDELKTRYPTVVFGYVEQVLFKELKAIFIVEAVQDEDVQLPERHEVALIDLWPTRKQENTELNVERTADCIDRLRFFYTQVWMPWDNDNDDDMNWVDKHLKSRIRFCYDLSRRDMRLPLAAHIRQLLLEARYIQQRREYLEIDISDDESDKDLVLNDTTLENKAHITDLMRLHLRLTMIRSEIEMLENPELRQVIEQVKFDEEKHVRNINEKRKDGRGKVNYIVLQSNTLNEQLELLQTAKQLMEIHELVHLHPTLQSVLSCCGASDSIFLAPGTHKIKFLEYLNDNGRMCGLTVASQQAQSVCNENEVILTSCDDDSILLVFDGNFTLENLMLDCTTVRTGILIKRGHVTLRNCRIVGDGKTSTQMALNCGKEAELTVENCIFENFATGIAVNECNKCLLKDTKFIKCSLAISLTAINTQLKFEEKINFLNCKTGILVKGLGLETNVKQVLLNKFEDIKDYTQNVPDWSGNCCFKNCNTNILVQNQNRLVVKSGTMERLINSEFENVEKA